MRRWLERLSKTKREQALASIEEVRLALAGDPLHPDGAVLLIIGGSAPITAAVIGIWDDKWAGWRDALEAVNIALLPNEYTDLDQLSARSYNESFKIPLQFAFA